MAAIKPRKLTMPVRRVTRFDEAINRGLSALADRAVRNDRKRQLPRIALNQVSWISLSEQLRRKLIGNCENSRFHVENGAATKGFVDNTAQTRMVWLVHGQHADGERA